MASASRDTVTIQGKNRGPGVFGIARSGRPAVSQP